MLLYVHFRVYVKVAVFVSAAMRKNIGPSTVPSINLQIQLLCYNIISGVNCHPFM